MLSQWLILGVVLSCIFAIGWVYLMRVMKLATAGVIYGVTSAVLLCLIGVVFFGEKLSPVEVAGVVTATLAIILGTHLLEMQGIEYDDCRRVNLAKAPESVSRK
jgi:drug/metabolite transporter (DMT)-like permease